MISIPTMTTQKQQRGVVLVVSLMILLILTLLGISSLDGSIMEEKMASNAQAANTTFQKAESAIRQTYHTENEDPIGAFLNAENGDTETYTDTENDNLDAGTVMSVPATTIKSPMYNSSVGFEARRIEITGNANIDDIESNNTQGYNIFPMLAVDESN